MPTPTPPATVPAPSAPVSARARVRAELTREIVEAARRQLAAGGAASLSLRAVARELGMASSAVYRYFPSRDALLTALIIDAYDAMGEAAEQADTEGRPDDVAGRWRAVCRAVRRWALDHPHEYALIYGSPVPGYQAPQDTIGPATRVAAVFGGLLAEAASRHALVEPAPAVTVPVPAALAADIERLRAVMPGVPDAAVLRGLMAWTQVFGTVSFELFGQFTNVIEDGDTYFDHVVAEMSAFVGFPPADLSQR